MRQSRFIKACYGEPTDTTPIWLMRQAGRYMAEYRALRTKYSILDIIYNAELSCEVTLQPIKRFDLDAAIIFADILPPLATLGLNLAYIKGEGPLIDNPIRSAQDVARLTYRDPRETLPATLRAITLVNRELQSRNVPLIGFAGAPFTLASYAIEGMGGTQRITLKQFMHQQPDAWHQLMSLLATLSGEYLLAQAEAGAHALQLFDSWVGELSPADYRRFVQPYSQQAIAIARKADIPIIHFGTSTAGLLTDMHACGGDVLGVDWRIDLARVRAQMGADVVLQGNLDPALLFSTPAAITHASREVIDQIGSSGKHIFNVGHGIMPETPLEHVEHLIDIVHTYGRTYAHAT
jgi:uroporphyrinogen decarboxylase